tara:strand:+ start:365 stop:898 length:534 start_codon:yes stop_codon:yes gene_type:complete
MIKYVLALLLALTCSIGQASTITGYQIVIWNSIAQKYSPLLAIKEEGIVLQKAHELAKEFADSQQKFWENGTGFNIPRRFGVIAVLSLEKNELLPAPYRHRGPNGIYISISTNNNSRIVVPTKAKSVWEAFNYVTIDKDKFIVVAGETKITLNANEIVSYSFHDNRLIRRRIRRFYE